MWTARSARASFPFRWPGSRTEIAIKSLYNKDINWIRANVLKYDGAFAARVHKIRSSCYTNASGTQEAGYLAQGNGFLSEM